ncbi:hypothetical protein [Pseudoneobacillus sp. C159]
MELIKGLEPFVGEKIEVAIHDAQEDMQPPWVEKKIKKLELCPDGTHLRIYFDTFYFFAVPLTSSVSVSEHNWSAYDMESGLYYLIRKI